jgi:DNA-binding NtrC family response regulator
MKENIKTPSGILMDDNITEKGKILVVDDEKDMLVLLDRMLTSRPGFKVITCSDSVEAIKLIDQKNPDLVITDLKMPNLSGMEILEHARKKSWSTAVIIMTAYATIESAVEATRKGAFDYITKPFRKDRILRIVEQAFKWRRLELENLFLRKKLSQMPSGHFMIGNSQPLREIMARVAQVAETSATILITGESGTGKELVARAIHACSDRRDKEMVIINCSAIPENLIESELFGHVRGSFTGAVKDKKGLAEEASGGTLFLDEIGDLDLSMQVKLLRLIQEGEYKAVGGNRTHKVDIRYIAATHRNLQEMISTGEFREDLFYRLNVINIFICPLRERKEDIPLLVDHFLKKFSVLHGRAHIKKISQEAMDLLMDWSWPGNVRELENVIERGVILSSDEVISSDDLSMGQENRTSADTKRSEIFEIPFKDAREIVLKRFQSDYIARCLEKNQGNVSRTAHEIGVKRQYLHRLMKDAGLSGKEFKG